MRMSEDEFLEQMCNGEEQTKQLTGGDWLTADRQTTYRKTGRLSDWQTDR